MILNIAGYFYDTDDLEDIYIREDISAIFITTTDNQFQRIDYEEESEINDLLTWQNLQSISRRDVHRAMNILFVVCEYYVNSKSQCEGCPLHNEKGCLLNTIPVNWR